MDVREKLVELLDNFNRDLSKYAGNPKFFVVDDNSELADHLIANGVTVQDVPDNNAAYKTKATELPRDFGRWIPVEERKPDLFPCSAGTAYSEAVNVLTSGHKVITAIWDGTDFIGDAEFWEAGDEVITHWTPVLLPLPEPPKGE